MSPSKEASSGVQRTVVLLISHIIYNAPLVTAGLGLAQDCLCLALLCSQFQFPVAPSPGRDSRYCGPLAVVALWAPRRRSRLPERPGPDAPPPPPAGQTT
jgi:hypothetical protein